MLIRPGCSVHVRNIPPTATYNDLWNEFGKHGEVVNVTIPVDVNTAKGKGYAFVEFAHPDNAAKAINAMNGVQLWGRIVTLEYSRSYPKTSREMAIRSALGSGTTFVGPSIIPLQPLLARKVSPPAKHRHSSHSSSRSDSHRSHTRRRRSSSYSSSHSSTSRGTCSCCSRRSRSRSRISSYRSRLSQTLSRSRSGSRALTPASSTKHRHSCGLRSEGEVSEDTDFPASVDDLISDDLPDSLVIEANLMPSPSRSASFFSASSRSSGRRSIERHSRKRRKRRHYPRSYSTSSSTSCSD